MGVTPWTLLNSMLERGMDRDRGNGVKEGLNMVIDGFDNVCL